MTAPGICYCLEISLNGTTVALTFFGVLDVRGVTPNRGEGVLECFRFGESCSSAGRRRRSFFGIADHDCFCGPKQKGPTEQNAL